MSDAKSWYFLLEPAGDEFCNKVNLVVNMTPLLLSQEKMTSSSPFPFFFFTRVL